MVNLRFFPINCRVKNYLSSYFTLERLFSPRFSFTFALQLGPFYTGAKVVSPKVHFFEKVHFLPPPFFTDFFPEKVHFLVNLKKT
jgi:hypothetical protein